MEDIAKRLRSWVKDELQESDPAAVIILAAEEIERLRGERRWIAVSERMPVDIPHGYCLVTDGTDVGTANYSKESKVFDHCIDRDYWKPTHWMPLPEPPEVK